MPNTEIPKSALNFAEDLHIDFEETDEVKKASMLGYSGQPMDHPWFGKLVIDVAGIKFRTSKVPILEDHDDEKKLGWSKKPSIDNNQIYFDDITLLDNTLANEFHANAKKGFPYQASISIYPNKLEEFDKDSEVEVNGYKLKGPGLIFRESVFRESSVVTFGMDHRTNSQAYSDNEMVAVSLSESDASIINKLIPTKEPDMSAELEAKIAEIQKKVEEYEAKFSETSNENESLKANLLNLQKENFQKDLTSKVGEEDAGFLMKFYGSIPSENLEEIAGKFKNFQEIINDLGKAKGSDEVPSEQSKEPTVEDVKNYAKENGLSFVEANRILYKTKRS